MNGLAQGHSSRVIPLMGVVAPMCNLRTHEALTELLQL